MEKTGEKSAFFRIRVLRCFHLDAQRGTCQFERLADTTLQVTLVFLSHVLQLVAMHHHHRWIHPALVGITQFRAMHPAAFRLLVRHRFLEYATELRGRHFSIR